MKKTLTLLLVLIMVFSLSACNNKENNSDELQEQETQFQQNELEKLETIIDAEVQNTIDTLYAEFNELSGEIKSFDDYVKNEKKIAQFYKHIDAKTRATFNGLKEYTLKYAVAIMESQYPTHIKAHKLEDLYECLYVSACDKLYDEIYTTLLDQVLDAFHSGALDEYTIPYEEASEIISIDYNNWDDTRSNVKYHYEKATTFIYNFYYDLSEALSVGDLEKANSVLDNYKIQL